MAKIDVVVPCYNYGRFLENCVGSVLNQSVRDVRVLIIDDASSDNSVTVAQELARADPRVTLIAHPTNKGHIETYNEGIAWASSDYFLLLSADDLLVPGALQRAADIMDANQNVVLTFGDCVAWFDTEPAPLVDSKEDASWETYDLLQAICASATNLVPTPTAIVRTSAQKAVGGYRKSLPHAGDMEMWLRFAANGEVAKIKSIQAIYRKHETAMSNAYFASTLADWRQRELAFKSFFDEHKCRPGFPQELQKSAREALANGMFRQGAGFFRRGRFKDGVTLIYSAMEIDPRLRRRPPLWRLFKIPGPAGRNWVKTSLANAAKMLIRREAGALSALRRGPNCGRPK